METKKKLRTLTTLLSAFLIASMCMTGGVGNHQLVAKAQDNEQRNLPPDMRRDWRGIRQCSEEEVAFLYGLNDDESSGGNSGLSGLLGKAAGMSGEDWLQEGTDANKVAQQIYDYFTQKIGTSGAFAVGVLSNVREESHFDPQISQGGGHFGKHDKEPDSGGPGGGLYQFTPYSKYTNSKQFEKSGWEVEPQSEFVWNSEFRSGEVQAYMALVPARTGGDRMGFPKMVNRSGNGEVKLDKNAWLTTSDPIEASATFQLSYERPGQYHPEREKYAAAAEKVFNKDHYEGDAKKLEKALGKTGDGAGTGNAARDAATDGATGIGAADKEDLFRSPCIDPKSGTYILDLEEAIAFADETCSTTGSGGSGRTFGDKKGDGKKDGKDGENMVINGVTVMNWDHLRPKTQKGARMIAEEFGDEIDTIGGWRPYDDYPDHPGGFALDVMIPDMDKKTGDSVNQFFWKHAGDLNLNYTIWRQQYYESEEPMNTMGDRGGDTANHFDHVHATIDMDDRGTHSNSNTAGKGKSSGKGCSSEGGSKNGAISADGVAIPAEGTYTSGWGPRWGTFHDGLDIANDVGTPIYAVMDGTVVDAGPAQGYGQWVVLDHGDDVYTEYGHISSYSVSKGDKVKAGDEIAKMGAEGQVTGPHLHLRLRAHGRSQQGDDPEDFFRENGYPDFPEQGGKVTLDMGDGKKSKKDKD